LQAFFFREENDPQGEFCGLRRIMTPDGGGSCVWATEEDVKRMEAEAEAEEEAGWVIETEATEAETEIEAEVENGEDEEEDEDEDEEEDTSSEPAPRARTTGIKGCRDMTKCFTNGQRIRHAIGINNIWFGTYDYSNNKIIHDEIAYDSLTKFATTHVLRDYNPDRTTVRNGWKNCECEVDGKWISTYSLPL
jgi:hypothetical protein